MKKSIYYPPVIRVRRPKAVVAPVAAPADDKPVRTPYGHDLRRQILGEFTAAARKLAR